MRSLVVIAISLACGRSELDGRDDAGAAVDLECHPGGPMRVLVSEPGEIFFGLFVDEQSAYFVDETIGVLEAVPRTGGTARALTPAHDVAGGLRMTSEDLLYLTTNRALARVSRSSGVRTLVDVGAHGGGVVDFTTRGDDIWAMTIDGTLVSLPHGAGAVDVRASLDGQVAATSSRLYVVRAQKPLVVRMALDGSQLETIPPPSQSFCCATAAPHGIYVKADAGLSYLADDASSFVAVSNVGLSDPYFADDECLYYATEESNAVSIRCLRLDGTTSLLIGGLALPGGFALHGACMYIADTSTVFRLRRP